MYTALPDLLRRAGSQRFRLDLLLMLRFISYELFFSYFFRLWICADSQLAKPLTTLTQPLRLQQAAITLN
ncbi:uncharacterized protein BDV14DRAFT_109909 [Aspergillus stella-maris]|uniref:uncharacterized protein n=1 Tax=Aspergillus stella-maris TaxID=1810926 RepID=UPI003CCD6D27